MSSIQTIVRRSVETEFDRFLRSREARVSGSAIGSDQQRLQKVCCRPELIPLLQHISFCFDENLPGAGLVAAGNTIHLRPDILDDLTVASVLTRHTLELCLLQRLLPGQQEATTQFVIAALACHTSARYYHTLNEAERLVDPKTGLNKYGCSPKPRPWAVTFASCTGSSISDMGYRAAEMLRENLLIGAFRNNLEEICLDQAERTRREIARVFGLDHLPGTEIILSSSGTDVELTALYLTLGGHDDMVTNIVIAPNEVGSGTIPAARGCHFDSLTPMGSRVEPGMPVAGVDSKRVRLLEIPIRHATGEPVDVGEIDRQIVDVVGQVCSNGGRVLLHLLDSSKTGAGAPSIATARNIKKTYGERVNVLVDGAQMRLSRQSLQDYVANGFLVLVTGSKFFTGPPFCGALVVPPPVAQAVDTLPQFPIGFADYATPSDFPNRWRALTSHLAAQPNLGLLLRWQAALWEIKAFYAVPPIQQFETARRFLTTLVDAIRENTDLELVTAPALERLCGESEAQWDRIQTIFSFLVKRQDRISGKKVVLNFDETQCAYQWLNMDISSFLPDSAQTVEKRIAAIRCHIGQPVRIFRQSGTWYAALRIAIGARLISGVEFDPMLGNSPEDRLATELEGALTILKKLSVICRRWDELAAADIGRRHAETIDGILF